MRERFFQNIDFDNLDDFEQNLCNAINLLEQTQRLYAQLRATNEYLI